MVDIDRFESEVRAMLDQVARDQPDLIVSDRHLLKRTKTSRRNGDRDSGHRRSVDRRGRVSRRNHHDLAVGNLGGNLTPIGSASTLVAFAIIHETKLPTSFGGFVAKAAPSALGSALLDHADVLLSL